ncbi:MAG: hypothetical protein ACLRSW_16520 [Christensenellaceae bacterium]
MKDLAFPKHFTFATFEGSLQYKKRPVLQWFVNSFIVSVSSAILILFVTLWPHTVMQDYAKLNHVLYAAHGFHDDSRRY